MPSDTTATTATLVSLHARNYRLFPANKEGSCVDFQSLSLTLVGPSGFGKTTVFATINDLLFYCKSDEGNEPPSHCTLTDNSVSVVILRIRCGDEYYVLGMRRDSNGVWYKFGLCDDDKQSTIPDNWCTGQCFDTNKWNNASQSVDVIANAIAYLPQDYGFRRQVAVGQNAKWLFTYDSFRKKNRFLSTQTIDALAKITTVQVDSSYSLFPEDNEEKDVFYFQKNDKFPFSRVSGGQLDVIMTMYCATSGRPIVLLDEPGQNVGAAERGMLRQVLDSVQGKPQILMVTHHTEMMNFESFPKSAIRVAIDHTSSVRYRRNIPYSKAVYQSYEAKIAPKDKELLFQGHILPSIFARFVLLVEGHTDVPVLEKFLSSCRDAYDIKLGLRIIACGGYANLQLVDKMLTALEVDHMVLYDTDVVFHPTAERKEWLPTKSDGLLMDLINRWSRHWVNLLYGTELNKSYGRDILLENFWRSFTVVPRELLQQQQAIEELEGYLEDNAEAARKALSYSLGQAEVEVRLEMMSELGKLELEKEYERVEFDLSQEQNLKLLAQLQAEAKNKMTNKLEQLKQQYKEYLQTKKLNVPKEVEKLQRDVKSKLQKLKLSQEKKSELVSKFEELKLQEEEEEKEEEDEEEDEGGEKEEDEGDEGDEGKLERMSELYNKVKFALISELKRLESPKDTVKTWFKSFLEKINALPGEGSEQFDVENPSLQDLADKSSRVFLNKLKAFNENDSPCDISVNEMINDMVKLADFDKWTCETTLICCTLLSRLRTISSALLKKWNETHPVIEASKLLAEAMEKLKTNEGYKDIAGQLDEVITPLVNESDVIEEEKAKFEGLVSFLNGSLQSQQKDYFLPCWNERFGIKDKEQFLWLASKVKVTGKMKKNKKADDDEEVQDIDPNDEEDQEQEEDQDLEKDQDQAKIQGEQSARNTEQYQTGFFEHGVDRNKYNEDYEKILDEFFYQAFVGSTNPKPKQKQKQAESKAENSKDEPSEEPAESETKESKDNTEDNQAEPLKSEPSVLIWPPSIADIEGLLYDKTVNSKVFEDDVQHWRDHDDRKKLCGKLEYQKTQPHAKRGLLDEKHKTIKFCKRAFEFAGIITEKKDKTGE